jgi:hypothetical protein
VVANTTCTSGITVQGRNTAGELKSEVITLASTTPVYATGVTTWDRLLKATRASHASDVAVIASAATATGFCTITSGAMYTVTLSTGNASAVNNGHQFQIIRLSGTGQTSLSQITSYIGGTKVASCYPPVSGTITGQHQYWIYDGMLLNGGTPSIITSAKRPFFNSAASVDTGSTKVYRDKIFLKNTHATLALTTATIQLTADPSTFVAIALESGLNGTNAAASRLDTAPTGCTAFGTAAIPVSNSQNHSAGAAQGVWLQLTLPSGASALNSYIVVREQGQSI